MILVCAATGAEARACRAGCADVGGLEVLRTGVGPERAGAALARRLAAGPRPALVVSSGFAGALGDDLPLHAWITAARLAGVGAEVPSPVQVPGARPCELSLAGGVVSGAPARRGAAVDMESSALAAVAARHAVPFAVLRLVSDTPAAPLPELAREAGALLAAQGLRDRLLGAGRCAATALWDLRATGALVRAGVESCGLLRDGWRERARALAAWRPLAPG